jgi:hypothetical protein
MSGLASISMAGLIAIGIVPTAANAAVSVNSTPTAGLSYIQIDDGASITTKGPVIPFGEKLYVWGQDGSHNLYETDGTAAGTKVASGFESESFPIFVGGPTAQLDGKLYANVNKAGSTSGFKVIEYDGSSVQFLSSEIRGGVVAQDGDLFAGVWDGVTNRIHYPLAKSSDKGRNWTSVCTTDSSGDHTWKEIANEVIAVGDRYVFATVQDQENSDRELWVYDTHESSCDYFDVNGDTSVNSNPGHFVEFNDDVYFIASTAASERRVYKFDGTTVTEAINPPGTLIASLDVYDSKLFFSAGSISDTGIFTSLGDDASRTEIVDVSGIPNAYTTDVNDPLEGRTLATNLTEFRGELYFNLQTSTSGMELWRYNEGSVSELEGKSGTVGLADKGSSLQLFTDFNPLTSSPLGLAFRGPEDSRDGLGIYNPEYEVSYNSNGGSGNISDSSGSPSVSLDSGTSFERSGFELAGWNTKADGTGSPFALSGTISPANRVTELFAQWQEIQAPAPYSGPLITSVGSGSTINASSTETIRVSGERLGSVSGVLVDGKEGTVVSAATDHFMMTLPEGLTNGTHDLVVQSSIGNLTYLDAITVVGTAQEVEASEQGFAEVSAWTKRISDTQLKVYVKYPTVGEKVRISRQTGGSGDYETVYVKTTSSETMQGLRVVEGVGTYIVRTINLSNINRIRVTVGGSELVQVRYNN